MNNNINKKQIYIFLADLNYNEFSPVEIT